MKHTVRFLALLLALVMTVGLCATAFADDADTGSITINNAVDGKEYAIYRIFNIDSHDDNFTALNYKMNPDWKDFFAEGADGLNYVDIDSQGYVTWKNGAKAADFAEEAMGFANARSMTPDKTATAQNGKVSFTGLPLGYYLVKSGVGTTCSLDTTKPNVTIQEKNGKPTVTKQVQENSTGGYGKTNDAEIGATVNFRTTVNVIDGNPTDYVLHDKMSVGLTYRQNSLTVKIGDRILVAGTDYTAVTETTDDCTFEIAFEDGVLKTNDVVTVEYSAVINENAVVAGAGNDNDTWLKYDVNSETEHDHTKTFVWELNVFKFTTGAEDAAQKTPLAGAEFVLYQKETVEGVEKMYYARFAGGKLTGWTENKEDAAKLTSGNDGKINVQGLDAGTYYLEETAAPKGYNKLKEAVNVVISSEEQTGASGTPTRSHTVKYGEGMETAGENGVEVLNQTGAELPSTGGIGTTVFYALGSVLALGAAILLVTKKRMAA